MKAELILCQSCDENLQNIKNVFSEISADNSNKISFTAICRIIYSENDLQENRVHIFIVKHLENKTIRGLYLAEVELLKTNSNEESFKDEFLDVPVEGKGRYSIAVVLNNVTGNETKQNGTNIYNNGNVIGEIFFDVV